MNKGKNLSKQQRLASQKIQSAAMASTQQQPNPSFLLSPFGHQAVPQPDGPNPASLPVVST
jgi:hypothetical protein